MSTIFGIKKTSRRREKEKKEKKKRIEEKKKKNQIEIMTNYFLLQRIGLEIYHLE
jgi:hypothetical protein